MRRGWGEEGSHSRRRASARHAGLRLQHASRQVQGPARSPRFQPRLQFRGNEQDARCSASTRASAAISKTPSSKRTGIPQGRELEILSEYKNDLPPELFTTEWKNPVYETAQDTRKYLGEAMKLLNEAGWQIKPGSTRSDQCQGRAADGRVPAAERAVQPTYRSVHLQSAEARHSGLDPRGRSGAI